MPIHTYISATSETVFGQLVNKSIPGVWIVVFKVQTTFVPNASNVNGGCALVILILKNTYICSLMEQYRKRGNFCWAKLLRYPRYMDFCGNIFAVKGQGTIYVYT